MGREEGLRISADWTSAVSPFTQTHAMECMRAWDSDQSGDGRIHSLKANWAGGELVDRGSIRCGEPGNRGGCNIFGVNRYGQDADNMAYLRFQ